MYILRIVLLLLLGTASARAITIRGEVLESVNRTVISNVNIQNIHVSTGTVSDIDGKFSIEAEKGQLIEFRKIGYKTVRLRIPEGIVPEYFRITMEMSTFELPEFELTKKNQNYKRDSVEYRELYKSSLEFQKLSAVESIRHPFSALSKRNRQIWAFQEEYNRFEQQKYVDYTFSETLVKNLTGLQGDSAQTYLRLYRPSYDMLRSISEYEFYRYVKQTVANFRRRRY